MKTNTVVNLIAALDFVFLLVAAVTLILTVDRFRPTDVITGVSHQSTQVDRTPGSTQSARSPVRNAVLVQ